MKLYCFSGFCIALVILVAFLQPLAPGSQQNSPTSKENTMKLNAGIITSNLQESKNFYTQVLNFGVTFENDFYVLMHTPDKKAALSFLLPGHPAQQPIFQQPFTGQGVFLTIEVADADAAYKRIKELGVDIVVPIRSEPWGDRHFSFYDPNGVAIDIVKYTAPVENEESEKKGMLPVHL